MTRDEYVDLFDKYWPISVGVGVIVVLATLRVVWRYRAGRVGEAGPAR